LPLAAWHARAQDVLASGAGADRRAIIRIAQDADAAPAMHSMHRLIWRGEPCVRHAPRYTETLQAVCLPWYLTRSTALATQRGVLQHEAKQLGVAGRSGVHVSGHALGQPQRTAGQIVGDKASLHLSSQDRLIDDLHGPVREAHNIYF
jgi:hypothetical protein